MTTTHVFFDIGGVLGTNGWDREQRARAAQRFGLDEEFERRHEELVSEWEAGRLSLDEYLDIVVFYEPRGFARDEFVAFMRAQSEPFADSIAVAHALAGRGRVRLMTLNNEAEMLNLHRIEHFGLRGVFQAFFSSCWLGVRKPARAAFERALGMAQAHPRSVLFVDDREQNLVPARALGLDTIHFTGAAALDAALHDRGLL